MKTATITATYVKRGTRFRVLIRPAGGPRISRSVKTEQDAIDLVRHFNRLGMAGVDVAQALRDAKASRASEGVCRRTREALPAFLDEMVALGEMRESTARSYKNRLAVWAYPMIGEIPWNLVTREEIGGVVRKLRAAKKSLASLEQIRCPFTKFYQWQINAHGYKGPNPAADLKFFIGKQPTKKSRKRDLQWFRPEEARRLLETCNAALPRWYAFLMVAFGTGLRWGEVSALYTGDIDWKRARLHVQRTWSEDGGRIEACKDGEDRWVKMGPAVAEALREHLANVELEASVKGWTPEQRQLVFPNTRGHITRYGTFMEHVWQPLHKLTQLPYRKPHAMRHSYATWLLEDGADLRFVKNQMGHASIEETEGTYGHLQIERHEPRVDRLDQYLAGVRAEQPTAQGLPVPPRPTASHLVQNEV